MRHIEAGICARLIWFTDQLHVGFFRGAASLAVIAFGACAGYICPLVFSPAMSGYDVIYGKQGIIFAAVLAGIIVTAKYSNPGEFVLVAGGADHIIQTDNSREGDIH